MSAAKKSRDSRKGLADDDRNLVLVDGDFSEADLDDRFWLIWERYKRAFLIGGAVIFLGGMGAIVWSAVSATKAETLGSEYNNLTTAESKMSFAEHNPGEPLAVVAALEAADAAYKTDDLKTAGDRFARAEDIAKAIRPVPTALYGRAVIGRAVCALRSGDASAVKHLEAFAEDGANEDAVRAHALYLLAQNACGEKDFVAAKKYLDRIDRLQGVAGWRLPDSPKSQLIAAFPELLAATATPVKK